MKRIFAFGFILAFGTGIHAQTINVRGQVSDGTGQPVGRAVVELLRQGVQDTTGADGAYSLTKTGISIKGYSAPLTENMTLDGGILELTLNRKSPLTVEIFDLQGDLQKKETLRNAQPGVYHLNIAENPRSSKMLIIYASIGKRARTFRYFPRQSGTSVEISSFTNSTAIVSRLAKVAAMVDTLKVTAAGFPIKKIPLSSYDTTINVTLDASSDRWGGLNNPPGKSSGCGKATTVTSGKKTILSTGQQRKYIIDIPANYDMNKPYRLFYCSHWIGSTSEAVVDQNYYFLKPLAAAANEPAIFIAPQADGATWQEKDHALFDDILAMAKANLCVDTTRVFATGFSFGGMITYSLSTNHQKQIRAAVGIAPANYNIFLPNPIPHDPIAWMQTTGMGDGTCPWVNGNSTTQGAKFIALQRGHDNGCKDPATIPTWTSGAHVCYDFQGCKPGYPAKACTFNGPHTNIANDPGSNANWIPVESWKFFTQF